MKKNNTLRKQKNTKLYNKHIFTSFFMVSVIAIGALVAIPKTTQQLFNFEGINFGSQSEAVEYALSNSRRLESNDRNYYYKYNNKVYSFSERNAVIDKMILDSQLREESTYKNVNDYVISNSGELSANVKTENNDELKKVYKGRNGFSYVDIDEAARTFQNYDEVILMENLNKNSTEQLEFYNESEAIQYLENMKKESLDNGEESDCYLVSGSCQDEGAVKQWLKSSSTYKYRYKDYEWSNFAPANLQSINLTSDDQVYKDNIFPFEPNKTAYWININNLGFGSYSGSQYIETNEAEATIDGKIQKGWKLKEETKKLFMQFQFINSF
ncbi:hypothetical protein [Spiroplasma alleghenense]|uniref:Uncharacterized protein n=1 Tax=Spiroplasma alleghenense TaxID=216931 RepID=A0A345Z2U7_9MOLU|nr:hypothetical protein [Spiroplasma alleghenense]AXK50926.1 hypothetical protein SALLE_v1c02500 [Spiroplasma alleghenense]